MGQNGLCEMTAQLPQVSLDAPGAVIGKNTADAMRSGLIFGHAAMVDGMIDRIKEQAGEELSVITTGAYAELIMPHCKRDMQNDPDLVLKGLNIIYKRNN
jgi:type III pantothenate kinase